VFVPGESPVKVQPEIAYLISSSWGSCTLFILTGGGVSEKQTFLLFMHIAALWALRGTFGPKKDEVIAGWRKLHNEELLNYLTEIIN
jgi:hypothetical protein